MQPRKQVLRFAQDDNTDLGLASQRNKERMATEFKLPELGENIDSGELVRLMIKPGVSITDGEPVMELETDKAVVEVPSSVTGTIGEIRVREGDTLRVGQVIFTVENGTGAGATSARTAPQPAVVPAVQASADPVPATPATPVPITASQPKRHRPGFSRHGQRVQAARTGREHRLRRSGAADDLARPERFRRPAGDGTRNRQSRGRSSVHGHAA